MTQTTTQKKQDARQKLSRGIIVESALALVRAEGLGALTMRRVAADLNSGAMSLYRHVADRDDLLIGMMDHVALSIEPPALQYDDREEIVAIMMAIHEEFRRDPWIVHVLLFEGRGSLKIMPLLDRMLAALSRLGCDAKRSIDHYNLLLHYAFGESLSYQTKDRRQKVQQEWSKDSFDDFPATKAISDAAKAWAYDEFERNVRRVVAQI